MNNPNQIDRLNLRIAELERCLREAEEEVESSAFYVSDRAHALVMLERVLRVLRSRATAEIANSRR